jgi:hypothetical protein
MNGHQEAPFYLTETCQGSRSFSSPSARNNPVPIPKRTTGNLPNETSNRSDSDAFRLRYYQTLARRNSTTQAAIKENPSDNSSLSAVSRANSNRYPSSNLLSRSAPLETTIQVQRSAPMNIPIKRQSARGLAYAYARNSQHNNNYLDTKFDQFDYQIHQFNHNDEDDCDPFVKFDDDSFPASKELSSQLYYHHFPLTHSVDFEL